MSRDTDFHCDSCGRAITLVLPELPTDHHPKFCPFCGNHRINPPSPIDLDPEIVPVTNSGFLTPWARKVEEVERRTAELVIENEISTVERGTLSDRLEDQWSRLLRMEKRFKEFFDRYNFIDQQKIRYELKVDELVQDMERIKPPDLHDLGTLNHHVGLIANHMKTVLNRVRGFDDRLKTHDKHVQALKRKKDRQHAELAEAQKTVHEFIAADHAQIQTNITRQDTLKKRVAGFEQGMIERNRELRERIEALEKRPTDADVTVLCERIDAIEREKTYDKDLLDEIRRRWEGLNQRFRTLRELVDAIDPTKLDASIGIHRDRLDAQSERADAQSGLIGELQTGHEVTRSRLDRIELRGTPTRKEP